MDRKLTIHPLDPVIRHGMMERGALLEDPETEPRTLWFRAPEAHASCCSSLADAFVIATLFHAMRRGLDVHVRGPVSSALLRNLHEYQTAWNRWMPDRYHVVDMKADEHAPEAGGRNVRAMTAFSGGLDSCFTVWHQTRMAPPSARHTVDTGLMVHGLDIPMQEPYIEVFERAAEKSRRILESAGVSLITVATNARMLDDLWDDAHGAAVAACLHAMGGGHGAALIPGTHAYEALRFPFGSNPLTDPMLSSERLAIIYEGAGFSRVEKARAVADWPEALRDMRVCWEGDHLDRNCGACLKCVSFAICFAVNELRIPECMPIHNLTDTIRDMMHIPMPPFGIVRMTERLALARQRGIHAPWVQAAEEWLRRSIQSSNPSPPSVLHGPRRVLSRLATRYFSRT